jgi:hypothetical protein
MRFVCLEDLTQFSSGGEYNQGTLQHQRVPDNPSPFPASLRSDWEDGEGQ